MNAEELYARFFPDASAAACILSVALMLMAGFLMTRITKKLKLPNVTAYIVAGILLGPFCLDLIPSSIVQGMGFLPDIALAFIAFSTGEFFKVDKLKRSGLGVVIITLFESLLATILVFILCVGVLHLSLPFSAVLAALAAATASASTMMTIRQLHAKGEFVDTLLQVVAMDNIVSLVAYSVAISVATAYIGGQKIGLGNTLLPILMNIGALVLGGVFGFLTMLFMKTRHSTDNRLIIAITMLLTFCGICSLCDVSPLLGCMAMGTVYMNTTEDERLFAQLNYFSPPILVLFFVRSGTSFDLGALFGSSGSIDGTPLIVIGVGYFFVRFIGKYAGAFLGCHLAGKSVKIRNNLGLALIPQAGVAIGLAELGARTLGGNVGHSLHTIILASSILYELIGPACAKASLALTGSYSKELEQVVPVEQVTAAGVEKPPVELLIERIRVIQEEMAREKNPYEDIFEDEAEAYLNQEEDQEPKSQKRVLRGRCLKKEKEE